MTPRSRSVRIYVRDGLAEPIVEGTDLLVSVGRTPNTQGIVPEHFGIELDDRGFIKVNDQEHRGVHACSVEQSGFKLPVLFLKLRDDRSQ